MNFFAFVAISMVNTQMIPYLTSLGYDVLSRGYILAGSAIVAILFQFLFGYLCDHYKKRKLFFIVAYAMMLIASFAMYLYQKNMFFYHLLSVSFMSGMVKVVMALDETWMLQIDESNYGKLRACGALGLCIGSPLAGWIIKQFSYHAVLWLLAIFTAFLWICLNKIKDQESDDKNHIVLANIKQLLTNKRYLLLVLIYLLVYMIGTADQYVVIDKMLSIQASNYEVGIKWALQSFMEVPLFLFASQILAKYKTQTLLILGTIMYGIKFFLYGFSSEPWMIVLTSSLQLTTLPIIMLTSKVLIKEVSPKNIFNSAQMFAMAIFIGVSGLLTPIITSYLSKNLGYNVTLYIVGVFACIPLLLTIYYVKIRRLDKAA